MLVCLVNSLNESQASFCETVMDIGTKASTCVLSAMRSQCELEEVSAGHVMIPESGRTSWPTSLVPPLMHREGEIY